MAEEQVMPQALVLQNENEKMLGKLRNMQLNNLTEGQLNKLVRKRRCFVENFRILSNSFFGLSQIQLVEFSENELKVLERIINRKARPWAICQMIFGFCVPVVGWVFTMEGCLSNWEYICARKYLEKNLGKNWFPYNELKSRRESIY